MPASCDSSTLWCSATFTRGVVHSFDANQEHLEQLLAFPTISIGTFNQVHLSRYVQQVLMQGTICYPVNVQNATCKKLMPSSCGYAGLQACTATTERYHHRVLLSFYIHAFSKAGDAH